MRLMAFQHQVHFLVFASGPVIRIALLLDHQSHHHFILLTQVRRDLHFFNARNYDRLHLLLLKFRSLDH